LKQSSGELLMLIRMTGFDYLCKLRLVFPIPSVGLIEAVVSDTSEFNFRTRFESNMTEVYSSDI
jgi:hypothetical protein